MFHVKKLFQHVGYIICISGKVTRYLINFLTPALIEISCHILGTGSEWKSFDPLFQYTMILLRYINTCLFVDSFLSLVMKGFMFQLKNLWNLYSDLENFSDIKPGVRSVEMIWRSIYDFQDYYFFLLKCSVTSWSLVKWRFCLNVYMGMFTDSITRLWFSLIGPELLDYPS